MYLPPSNHVNKDHIKQLLADEKKAFRLNQVSHIKVPLLDELSTSNMLKMID